MNTALGRSEIAYLTNKSGGSVAQGDVVIVDTANSTAFTTTTTSAYISGRVGVVVEPNGIANNAQGLVAFSGYVPLINLSGTGSIGDLVKTHTVAKQAVRHAAPQIAGDFAQVLGTSATPQALLFGTVQLGAGSGIEPWLVHVLPTIDEPSAITGTWTLVQYTNENTVTPFAGTAAGATAGPSAMQSDGVQNSALSWDIALSAGTWNITVHCRESTNTGIFTVNIDGSSAGTVDSYNAGPAYGKLQITGVSIAASGKHTIELKMATKNASSSGYYGEIFAIGLRRTA